jgi:hypothetical protein
VISHKKYGTFPFGGKLPHDVLDVLRYRKRAFIFSSSFFRHKTFNYPPLVLYAEDSYTDPNLLSLNNTGVGNNTVALNDLDSLYSSSKTIDYLHYLNYVNLSSAFLNNLNSLSYVQVLTTFKENFDDFLDTTNFVNTSLDKGAVLEENDVRASDLVSFRIPGLANRKLFNAYQKLGKAKFDKNKSNVPTSFLSNTSVRYPMVSEAQVPYKKLLGKNTNSFITAIGYKHRMTPNFNLLTPVLNSLNTYFSTLPFLLALRGESMMYAWVDWYAR